MKKVFILAILLNACSMQSDKDAIRDFIVEPTFKATDSSTLISLSFIFKLNQDINIIFDRDALSIESYNTEKEKDYDTLSDLTMVSRKIKHPQFIIENKNNERRFFYDAIFFEGEIYYPKNIFKLERTIDTLRIKRNEPIETKSIYIDANRFKINENDSTVRLYYIYKATRQEREMGFNDIILRSNWFNLSP